MMSVDHGGGIRVRGAPESSGERHTSRKDGDAQSFSVSMTIGVVNRRRHVEGPIRQYEQVERRGVVEGPGW